MITDIEEETLDLDWFGVDSLSEVAHFATGGNGFLPSIIKQNKELVLRLTEYFSEVHLQFTIAREVIDAPSHVRFRNNEDKSKFADYYCQMAAKGLYSYCTFPSKHRPTGYNLVAVPLVPLKVNELPPDIRELVLAIRFNGLFSRHSTIRSFQML